MPPYLNRLWATDFALTSLLVLLLLYIFIAYPLGQVGSFRLPTTAFFSLILISGTIAVSRNRIFRTLVLSWGLLAIIFTWVQHLFPQQIFILAANGLALFFLLLLTFLILHQALREGPATSHRIMGAVAAYLLLGMIWSLAYYLIALLVPGAFYFQKSPVLGDVESIQAQLFYFSFITLTTIGYGDIAPVHPLARMLGILEGITGQLFPVILIARLVALHVQTREKV